MVEIYGFVLHTASTALIQLCGAWFYTVTETDKCSQKIANILGNKHSIFKLNMATFSCENKLIGADFDHVLGNHFSTVNRYLTINKTVQL